MLNHNLNVDLLDTGVLLPDLVHAGTTNAVASLVVLPASLLIDADDLFMLATSDQYGVRLHHALSLISYSTPRNARILANANGCAPLAGNVAPNFVMIDFVNIGKGKLAVDMLNGFA